MVNLGKLLQLIGLSMTGVAAVAGFAVEVSEGFFIAIGLGGFLVFVLGGLLRGRRS